MSHMSAKNKNMPRSEVELKEKYKPFFNLVLNEALIEQKPTLEATSLSAIDSSPEGSIYYGTGLTTPRAIAFGLPFDVLGMILVAERVRKTLDLKGVYTILQTPMLKLTCGLILKRWTVEQKLLEKRY